MMVALLSLGANVSAQEEAGAGAAADSTMGFIAQNSVVIGAVAVGVAAAIIANNDDDGITCDADEVLQNGACVCPTGQVKFNGVCTTQSLQCTDPRGGDLIDGVCIIPANTIRDESGITITNTITYLPVLVP